jgi:hypothetical protein
MDFDFRALQQPVVSDRHFSVKHGEEWHEVGRADYSCETTSEITISLPEKEIRQPYPWRGIFSACK